MMLMILTLNPMGLNQTRSSRSYPIKTASGEPLYPSRRRTFVLGFICTTKAVGLLSKDLLLSDKAGLEYLLTFRISQDHLESFFGKVRSMGGEITTRMSSSSNPYYAAYWPDNLSPIRSLRTLLIVKRTLGFFPWTPLRKARLVMQAQRWP